MEWRELTGVMGFCSPGTRCPIALMEGGKRGYPYNVTRKLSSRLREQREMESVRFGRTGTRAEGASMSLSPAIDAHAPVPLAETRAARCWWCAMKLIRVK